MYLKTISYITESNTTTVPSFPEQGLYKVNEQTSSIGVEYYCANCGVTLKAVDVAFCMSQPPGVDSFQCEACRKK